MPIATPTPITLLGFIAPIVIGFILIGLISLLGEPARQKFSAVFVAGAGAAYFGGGFGPWEMGFCAVVTLLAFRGLTDYRAIGWAWLLHSGWDLAHDFYGNPIIPFAPASSFGCLICDPVLAVWYLLDAPDLWHRFLTSETAGPNPAARHDRARVARTIARPAENRGNEEPAFRNIEPGKKA